MTEEAHEICGMRVEIEGLKQKLAAADKALSLAEKLGAAEKIASSARIVAIISFLLTLIALFKR